MTKSPNNNQVFPSEQRNVPQAQTSPVQTQGQQYSQYPPGAQPPKKSKAGGCIIAVVIVVVLLIIIGIFANYSSPVIEKTTKPAESQPAKLESDYVVVKKEQTTSVSLIMIIYTTEKDDNKLIALNDKLFNENKGSNTLVMIRYFDDKNVAETYFDKINTVSEKESDQMFTHYIADFKYNSQDGKTKELNKNQDGEWVTIKKY